MPRTVQIGVWTALGASAVFVPAIQLQTSTHHAIRVVYLANAMLIVALVGLAVGIGVGLVRRDVVAGLIAATMAVCLLFWWGVFVSVATSIHEAMGVIPRDAAVVVLSVTLASAASAWGRTWIVAGLFMLFFGGMVSAHLLEIATLSSVDQQAGSLVEIAGKPSASPNVVVVMMDGHPRADVAMENLGLDLDRVWTSAAGMGFTVNSDAWSNYSTTYASVSSMLSLDTLLVPEPGSDAFAAIRGVNGGDGEFLRGFSRAGYEVVFSPADWNGSRCGAVVDRCARFNVTSSNLYWLLRGSAIAPLAPSLLTHPWTGTSVQQLSGLSELHSESTAEGGPVVIWMHALLPHPPVTLDRSCVPHADAWRNSFTLIHGDDRDGDRLDAFADQILCADRIVIDELTEIVANDPDVVVVVISDHGPDTMGQDAIEIIELGPAAQKEKLAVLTAVRAPDGCTAAAAQPSTVETMREITRCVLGAEVSEAPVQHYISPSETGVADGESPLLVDVRTFP